MWREGEGGREGGGRLHVGLYRMGEEAKEGGEEMKRSRGKGSREEGREREG